MKHYLGVKANLNDILDIKKVWVNFYINEILSNVI